MLRLFVRLEAIYTARWRASAVTPGVAKAMKETWAGAMAGIDPNRIKSALAKLAQSADPWPPTPGQFRALCLPSAADLGLPDRETAWQQAAGNAKLSHPVVWHVREKVGSWNLKNLPAAATRRKFDDAWAEAVAQAAAGATFDWPARHDQSRQIEDTRGATGRRGPTAVSDAALRELREKWGRTPGPGSGPEAQESAPGAQQGAAPYGDGGPSPNVAGTQAQRGTGDAGPKAVGLLALKAIRKNLGLPPRPADGSGSAQQAKNAASSGTSGTTL